MPNPQALPSVSPAAAARQDGPPQQEYPVGRGRKPSAFAAAGAAAAAIPAVPGWRSRPLEIRMPCRC